MLGRISGQKEEFNVRIWYSRRRKQDIGGVGQTEWRRGKEKPRIPIP